MQYALPFCDVPVALPENQIPLVPLCVAGKSSFSEGANLLQTMLFGKAMVCDVPGRRIRLGISLESVGPLRDHPRFARGELKARVLSVLTGSTALTIDEILGKAGLSESCVRPMQQIINTLVFQKVLRRLEGKPVRFELKPQK